MTLKSSYPKFEEYGLKFIMKGNLEKIPFEYITDLYNSTTYIFINIKFSYVNNSIF